MRILSFQRSASTYTECFYSAIEKRGAAVSNAMLSWSWLRSNVQRGDVAHFHWPSFHYSAKGNRTKRVTAFIRFVFLLAMIRLKGARIAWTAHNLFPHERSAWPWLDVLGRHIVVAASDFIFVHGAQATRVLEQAFPAVQGKVTLIPHGHWIDYYRQDVSFASARARLGIDPAAFVYLFIGACKPYKNLDALINAFRARSGHEVLLIAGKFDDPQHERAVLRLIDKDPRIVIHVGFVADDDMQIYLRACNAVVAPYREILTSGTAMLALSFGRPIVSVNFGFLADIVSDDVGLLFEPNDPDGLATALEKVKSLPFDEAKIMGHARMFTFDDAAEQFLRALKTRR